MTLSRFRRIGLTFFVAALCAVWYVRFCPPMAWGGWKLTTLVQDVDRVSGLALGADGSLYMTQEYLSPGGLVIRLRTDHERAVVASGLDKPDGLFLDGGSLYISQEGGVHPMLKVASNGDIEEIPVAAANLEQIWLAHENGRLVLYGIEDRRVGNIVRYDFESGRSDVMAEGIAEGEGVSVCADGTIFYAEKETGEINRLTPGGGRELLAGGFNKPGFVACEAEGVWVTEDANLDARVYFVHRALPHRAELIVSHLRSAQYLVRSSPTELLLAEQDRGRVLLLSR